MTQITNNKIDLPKESVAWQPCKLGKDLVIGANCTIALAHIGSEVIIGDNCKIQSSAYIADKCVLGNNVFVGPNATLLNDKFPPSGNKQLWQPIIVKDGAVIGGGSTIIPGCNRRCECCFGCWCSINQTSSCR